MIIRALNRDDQELLWEFLRLAAHGNTISAVQNQPLLVRYVQDRGRKGDFGCVAYHDERNFDQMLSHRCEIPRNELLMAVAWARTFPAHDPGFGFLEAHIPEISLAVRPKWRGAEMDLLDALTIQAALIEKCEALSLSVREENVAAVQLYQTFGFQKVEGSEARNSNGSTSFTMRWDCSDLNIIF